MSLHYLNVIDHSPAPARDRSPRLRQIVPLFSGGGQDYFVCGDCCYPIAVAINSGNFRVREIVCPECGAVNAAR